MKLLRLPEFTVPLWWGGLALDKVGEFTHSYYWSGPMIRTLLKQFKRKDVAAPFELGELVSFAVQAVDELCREGMGNLKINFCQNPISYVRMGAEIPGGKSESKTFLHTAKHNCRAFMEVYFTLI